MGRLAALLVLGATVLVGCGQQGEPPLTTDQLPADAKTTDANVQQAGGNVPSRPQPNPNAPYRPSR